MSTFFGAAAASGLQSKLGGGGSTSSPLNGNATSEAKSGGTVSFGAIKFGDIVKDAKPNVVIYGLFIGAALLAYALSKR